MNAVEDPDGSTVELLGTSVGASTFTTETKWQAIARDTAWKDYTERSESCKALMTAAQKLMEWKLPTLARVANYWSMNTDTMGVYGNYYLKRAIITQQGLGANLPEDAIYPLNLGDEAGRPLDGANKYTLHFDKASVPPVDAFWSVTLYDTEGYQVPNTLNRFAVSSWMPFKYNADGKVHSI